MLKSNTNIINRDGDLIYITFPKLLGSKAVRCVFTTRAGGVSEGPLSSMNMGFGRGDRRENVIENYRRICSSSGIDISHLVFSKQTHTANVRTVTEKDRLTGFTLPSFEDIDGLVTNRRGVALVTQYADCTPLLFCDPKKRVIASAHSGWKGTVQQIGAVTVNKMKEEFGCDTKDIIAVIGPCIGSCCYEVDDPVYRQFEALPFDLSDIFFPCSPGHYMLDLRRANEKILLGAGIKKENIEISDICTCCNSKEMFSHRALGAERGNLAAIIELI